MKKKAITKISSVLLLLVMIMSVFFTVPFTASAADTQKVEKKYDIAVVYDNSGSMYMNNNKAWSRAKYAMEIFASMLDYSKDKLTIFPMWGVTTDKTKPDYSLEAQYRGQIEIKSRDDIDKITNMYTIQAGTTPFEPVVEAFDYLKKSNADEKWLLILTDGEFSLISRSESDSAQREIKLLEELAPYMDRGINIQYLRFGREGENIKQIESIEEKSFFAKTSIDTALKDDLIDVCNFIFQRSVLPKNRLNGDKLTLDLSMKNLIVFVQGEDAEILSLTDSSGDPIDKTLDSGQRKYSTIRAGHGKPSNNAEYQNAPIDTTLAGHVVTFAACPKGEYTLEYTGDRDKIQIFYEPDVDMVVSILDSEGNEIGPDSDVYAGEYTIVSKIVDGETGEDVTNHKLLGNDVELKTYVTIDGKTQEYGNGAKVEFLPETQVDILVEGTYLEGKYKISSADDAKLDWLKNIQIKKADFGLRVELVSEVDWFVRYEHDEWQPVKAELYMDGEPLTAEQMGTAQIFVESTDGLKFRIEKLDNESAYYIYLAQDENGNYVEPETGEYKLTATATFTDEYGESFTSETSEFEFEIRLYSKAVAWIIRIAIILLILLLIRMFRNRSTLPSVIYLDIPKIHTCSKLKVNGSSIQLSGDSYPGEMRCDAKACTPFKHRKKTTAAFEIKKLTPAAGVAWFEIDGERYTKNGAKYINSDGQTIEELTIKPRVADGAEIRWNKSSRTVTGTILINHND